MLIDKQTGQRQKKLKKKRILAFATAFLGWIEVSAVCGLWLYTQSLSIVIIICFICYFYDLVHMIW